MKKKKNLLKFLKDKLGFFSKHPWVVFLFLVFLGAFVSWQTFAAGTTYTWTNTGGDNLWENANNWSPVGVPGTQDLVVFNSTSVDDCFIYSNINIANFNIQSTYTGNIEHGTDYTFAITTFSQAGGTLSLNSGGTFSSTASLTGGVLNTGSKNITFSSTFSQSSGTVNGGSGNITFSSTFTLSSGTFNAPEGTAYFYGNFIHTGGDFDGVDGTVEYRPDYSYGRTMDIDSSAGSVEFNNFVFNPTHYSYYLNVASGDHIIVNGTTTLKQGYFSGSSAALEAHGDVVVESSFNYTSARNSFQLKLAGTEAQTMTIAGGTYLPRLVFAGASSTVYGPDTTAFAYDVETTAGNTHYIGQGGQLQFISPSFQSGGNLITNNTNLRFENSYTHSNGTATFGPGNITFGSTFTLSGGTFNAPEGNTYFNSSFTHTAGDFNGGIGTIEYRVNSSYSTIDIESSAGSVEFNNFVFNPTHYSYYLNVASGDHIIVNGTTTLKQGYFSGSSAALEAHGDVVVESSFNYTSARNSFQLKLAGTEPQTMTIAGGTYLPRLIFSGVSTTIHGPIATTYAYSFETVSGNVNYIGQGGQLQMNGPSLQSGGNLTTTNTNWYFGGTYTHSNGTSTFGVGNIFFVSTFALSGGTFNASESSIYFDNSFTHTNGLFDGGSGTVQFRGTNNTFNILASTGNTVTFNNVIINLDHINYYLIVHTGDKLVVNGTTTLRRGYLSGGDTNASLEARGDVVVESTYNNTSGRNTFRLNIAGTEPQTMTIADAAYMPRLIFSGVSTTVYGPSATTFAYSIEIIAGNTHYIGQGGRLQMNGPSLQSGGNLTTTNTNWYFDGTYTHSNGTSTFGVGNIIFKSIFTLSGGTINASESSIYFDNNFTHTGGLFDGGSGTVQFRGTNNTFNILASTGNTVTFNNVIINLDHINYYLIVHTGDKLVVNGTTTLRRGYLSGGDTNASLEARGDVVVESTYNNTSGRNSFRLNIAGTEPQIMTIADAAYMPRLIFSGVSTTIHGPIATTYAYTFETTAGNTHYIGQGGQLQMSGPSLQSGGNLTTTNTNWRFDGTYTHSNGTATFGSNNLYFNSLFTLSGGIFNAPEGNTYFNSSFTHTAGVFNGGSGTVYFRGGSNTFNITASAGNTVIFNNFILFLDATSYYLTISSGDKMIINGTTTLRRGYLGGGDGNSSLDAKGDIVVESTLNHANGGNTFRLNINGTSDQILTIAGGTYLPRLIFSGVSTTVYGPGATAYAYSFETVSGNVNYIGQGGQLQMNGPSLQSGGNLTTNNTNLSFSSTYTHSNGTATFGPGNITFGYTFTLSGGIFNAPAGNTYFNGNFNLSGGTFNASEENIYFNSSFTHTAGVFNGNSGTSHFRGGNNTFNVAVSGSNIVTFNNVILNLSASSNYLTISSGDKMIVNGTTTLRRGYLSGGDGNSSLDAKGDIVVESTLNHANGGNTFRLNINGTSDQILTIAGGTYLPRLIFSGVSTTVYGPGATAYAYSFETTAGNVNYIDQGGQLQMNGASLQSGGNLITNNTNLSFSSTYTHSNGTATFGLGNITFGSTFTLSGGTFNAPAGNTYFNGSFNLSGGTFNASEENIYFNSSFTHTAGVFNGNSGTVHFRGSNQTINIVATGGNFVRFNNFILNKSSNSYYLEIASGDVLNIYGDTLISRGYISGASTVSALNLRGDLTITDGYIQTPITFSGDNEQNINLNTVVSSLNGEITINKASNSLILLSDLTMDNSKNLLLNSGTFDLSDKSLRVTGSGATFVVADNTRLRLMGGATYSFNTGYPQFANNSIVEYYRTNTGTYNILSASSVGNMIINGIAGSVFRLNNSSLTVNGYLQINEDGTLFLNSNTLILSSPTNFFNEGILEVAGNEYTNLVNDTDSGTVSYVGNNDGLATFYDTLFPYYYNLKINFSDTDDIFNTVENINDSLIAYWSMDEGSGTVVYDQSGNAKNGNFGTGASAPTWTSGKFGTAINFDGSDLVSFGTDNYFCTANFSVEFWMKAGTQINDHPTIIEKYGPGYGNVGWRFGLIEKTAKTITYTVGDNSGGWGVGYYSLIKGVVTDNNWHHVVGTYDGRYMSFYIDGVLAGRYPWSKYTCASSNLYFGYSAYSSTRAYKGVLDEVKIYNKAIKAEDVKKLAGNLKSGLLSYWNMDEGSGNTINDLSGNGRHGTLGAGSLAPTWVTGKNNSGLSFDGVDDYVSASHSELDKTFSVSAWINYSNLSNIQVPIAGGSVYDYFFSNIGGTLYNSLRDASSNQITCNTNLTTGWHHYTSTINVTGTNVDWKIYRDGILVEQCLSSTGLTPFSLTRLGSRIDGQYYFSGILDDVAFYYRVLPVSEISDLVSDNPLYEATDSFSIYNNLEGNNGNFIAPSTTLYVGGNILMLSPGIFDANSGLVILNGEDQTIGGFIDFNDLTKTVTSSQILYVTAGSDIKIEGSANLSGIPNNLLSLHSTVSGTQANIDFAGARTVEFLDVKDIVNSNSSAVLCINGCVDSGNNINFTFVTAPPHYEVRKSGASSASVTAGEDLDISIFLIDEFGSVSSTYSGNYDIIFYGANNSPYSDRPTAKDIFENNRNFGSTTTLNFINGEATTTLKLYKNETVQIDVSGNNFNTSGSNDYALIVTVGSQILNEFILSSSANVISGIPFTIDSISKDAFGNITTYVNSDTTVLVTSSVASFAEINPTNISSTEFTDDGATATSFTISNITNLEVLEIIYHNDYAGNITTSSKFLSVTGIPTAPSDVAASLYNLNEFRITWNDTSGGVASGFVVERDTDIGSGFNNDWTAIATTTLANRSFIDNAINNTINPPQNNERYKYRVRAFNSVGYSVSYGNDPVAHYTIPGTPSNLTASFVSSSLRFDLNFSDNSAVSDYFSLDRCTGISCNSNIFQSVSSSFAGENISDASLQGNSRYRYRVKAIVPPDAPELEIINVSSSFAYSAYEYTAPSTPSDLNFYQVNENDWFISWKDNSNFESGFEIQVSYDEGVSFEPIIIGATVGQNVRSYLFTPSGSQDNLQFKVRAYISATDNNDELYSGESQGTQIYSSDFHYQILGSDNQIAGVSQNISIVLKDLNNNTSTFWSGDKELVFSGASSSINGILPTCSDKNGTPVILGNSTTVNFVEGVASCNLILYRATNNFINVSDGFYSTFDNVSYSLDVTVLGNSLYQFLLDIPSTINYSSSTFVTIYSLDEYYNNTTDVLGNTTLSLYVNSSSTGSISPNIIANTEFSDDGVWSSNITVTNIFENPFVTLTAQNGSAVSSAVFSFNGRPNTPGSVAVSYVSDNEFEITWQDRTTIETGYIVQKKTDTGSGLAASWTTIATLSPNTQSFIDNVINNPLDAPQSDRRYMYQIIATGNVVPSYGAGDNLIHYTTPDYPTNFYAGYVNNSRFNLYFTDNANVVNTHVFSRCDNADCDSSVFNYLGKTSSSPYIDTAGLLANSRYKYVAYSETPSPESLVSSDVYSAYEFTSPSAPSDFYVSGVTSNTISLIWGDNALYESGYTLEYAVASSSVFTPIYNNGITTVGADITGFSFVSSTLDSAYRFKIRSAIASTVRNPALYSSYVGGTEYVYSQPNAPTNQAAIFSTTTVISLSWDDNSDYEDGFRIEVSVNGGEWNEITPGVNTVENNITTYDLTDVDLNNDYQFRVRAHIAGNTFAPEVFSEYTEVFSPQSYHFEFYPENDITTVAGNTTTVTLALKDSVGNIVTDYSGNKNIYFSGASSSVSGVVPSVLDTNGFLVDFGSITSINFIDGEAEVKMFFSASGNFNIDANTLAYTTSESSAYQLRVLVNPNTVKSFSLDTDYTIVTSGLPFLLNIVAYDEFLNTSTAVSGNTLISTNIGDVDPVGISDVDFQDDGIWEGNITLSNLIDRESLYLYVYNGSANGEIYLTADGVPMNPSGVASSLQEDTEFYFSINWSDNSVIEQGYEIERCVVYNSGDVCGSSDWSLATSTQSNINNAKDYSITSDAKVKYRVRGFNSVGYSDWVEEINYHFTHPDAPTNVYAKRVGSRFDVYYTAQSSITNEHRIFRTDYYFESTLFNAFYSASSPFSDAYQITTNNRFLYNVRARTSDNLYSENSYSIYEYTTPVAPSSAIASIVNETQVQISWMDNSLFESGFRIEESINSSAWAEINPGNNQTGQNIKTYLHTVSSTSSNTYKYRIRAHVGATINNTELFSSYSNEATAEISDLHFEVYSPTSTTAGVLTTINFALRDINGNNASYFTGDRILRFSSDLSQPGIYCTDKNGTNIPFGNNTTVSFVNGVGSCNTILYNAVTTTINVSDDVFTSTSSPDFALNLKVNPNVARKFNIIAPFQGTSTIPAVFQVVALDFWNNTTTHIFNTTTLSVNVGSISPTQFSEDNFVNGIAFVTATISDITERPAVNVEFTGFDDLSGTPIYGNLYINILGVPNPPSAISSVCNSNNFITLNWVDNSTIENAYAIERQTDEGSGFGSWIFMGQTGQNVTSFVDNSTLANRRYKYRIRTLGVFANSAWVEDTINLVGGVYTTPAAPTNISPLRFLDTRFDISFIDNALVTNYFDLKRCDGSACNTNSFSAITSTPILLIPDEAITGRIDYSDSLNITTNNRYRYAFTVRPPEISESELFATAYSNYEYTKPTAPSDVNAIKINEDTIYVYWQDNSDYEDGFRIEFSTDTVNFVEVTPNINTVGANVESYNFTIPSLSATYLFRVRAHVPATSVNSEIFSDYVQTQTSETHLVVSGNSSQNVGESQTITLTIRDGENQIITSYNGDKSIILSGPSSALTGEQATCSDKNSNPVNIGLITTINFVDGVGQCELVLYRAENTLVRATDGLHTSYTHPSYNLNINAVATDLDNFLVAIPSTSAIETNFETIIYARDVYNNITKNVSGITSLNSNVGTLSVSSISQSEFTDDGIWFGVLSISGLYDLNTVVVTATNGAVSGFDSIQIIAPPNIPLNVLAEYISDDHINISWTDNSQAEDYYIVERRVDNTATGFGAWVFLASTTQNTVLFSDTTAFSNASFEYRVYANNTYGNSDYVNSNIIFTSLPAPIITSSTVLSANSMSWDWTSTALFSTEYRMHFSSLNHDDYINISSSTNNFTVADLIPNTNYEIVLYNWREDRGYSLASNTSTAFYTFSALPINIQTSTNTDETLTLTWNINSNPVNTEYKVKNISTGEESEWITNNFWTDNNLDCETSYDYQVKARNFDNIETSWSATTGLSTGLCVAPSIPESFSVNYIDDSRIDISWLSTDTYTKSFIIEKSSDFGSGFGSWSLLATSTDFSSTISDNSIIANSAYKYRIRAKNKIAESENFESSIIYTSLVAPTINTVSAVSDDSITFNWINNSNFVENFILEFVEGEHDDIENINSTSTSQIVTGLSPNTLYAVKVYAYNSSRGRSESSSTSTFVYTLAQIPASLNSDLVTDNSLNLNWLSGNNPTGTEYYVENINVSSTNSGWTTSTNWAISNLSCGSDYSFKIKTRNFDNIESVWFSANTFSTTPCPNLSGPSSFVYTKPSTEFLGININNGENYSNDRNVILKLSAGMDVEDMGISNDPNFDSTPQEKFTEIKNWLLSEGDGIKNVYARFFSRVGGLSSETYYDTIILDTTPPNITITDFKSDYSIYEKVIISGLTESASVIFIKVDGEERGEIIADQNGKWNLNLDFLAMGRYLVELQARDRANNLGKKTELIVNVNKEELVEEIFTEDLETIKDQLDLDPETISILENIWPKIKEMGLGVLKEISDLPILEKIVDKILDWQKDADEKIINIPLVDMVPKVTPLAFEIKWNLLPVKKFILAPLPKEMRLLAEKFPEFSTTLAETGVTRMTDMTKIKGVNFVLPNLSETILSRKSDIFVSLISSTSSIKYGEIKIPVFSSSGESISTDIQFENIKEYKFSLVNIPLAKLSKEEKTEIPNEIVFVKTADDSLDINTRIAISENGRPVQKINTISGTEIKLIIKPQSDVNSVKGYVVFKSSEYKQALKQKEPSSSLEKILTDIISGETVFAEALENSIPVEEKFVLKEFEYEDLDGDGIYTAIVEIPAKVAEYEIITILDYVDEELGKRQVKLITLVDPEGYVYEKIAEKELRVKGAVVSIYVKNLETGEYELWDALRYRQINPQVVGVTGDYSFLVPPGKYYIEVKAKGYKLYKSEEFTVSINDGIHENIELVPSANWKKYIDWKTILLVAFSLFLLYHYNIKNKFYKK